MGFFMPFFLLIIFFLFVPFFQMLAKSFSTGSGQLGFSWYVEIFTKTSYLVAIKNSIWIAICSTILGTVIDFLLALSLTNAGKRNRRWYQSLLNLTSTFAGLPLTLAFVTLLGTAGVFVLIGKNAGISWLANYNLYSLKGMFIIFLYFQIPMGTLLLLPAFHEIRKEWKEAALLMNCSTFRFWRKIGIPIMMPSVMGTVNMLFANALIAYTTPYLLVNNGVPLLPIKITDMFVGDVRQRPELGSALSIVMLLIMLLVLTCTNLVKKLFQKERKEINEEKSYARSYLAGYCCHIFTPSSDCIFYLFLCRKMDFYPATESYFPVLSG